MSVEYPDDILGRVIRLEERMADIRQWKEDHITALEKLSSRMQKVERYIWLAAGGLAVLQFITPLLKLHP